MKHWHVFPKNDLIEHNTQSNECPCAPFLDYHFDEDFCIVVHSAMDRREVFEAKNEKEISNRKSS
jgi:hypothetical protein